MDANAAAARTGLPFFLPRTTQTSTGGDDADPATTAATIQQQGSGAYSYFLFLAFIFFLMSGGPTTISDPGADVKLKAVIARRKVELAKFGDWYHGNATAPYVSPPDEENESKRPAWNNTFQLETFQPVTDQPIIKPLFDTLFAPSRAENDHRLYWQNVTGFIQGSWSYLDATSNSLSLPAHYNSTEQIIDNRGTFPFTAAVSDRQSMYMKLTEKNASRGLDEDLDRQMRLMVGSMELRSASNDMVLELEVEGVQ